MLAQVGVERLAAELLDQPGRDLVVRVVVVEPGARCGDEMRGARSLVSGSGGLFILNVSSAGNSEWLAMTSILCSVR